VSWDVQRTIANHALTEYDLYHGMNSKYTFVRESVEILFDEGFDMLHEIQQQLRCHEVQGVLKCEAVVIAAKPYLRVRGMLTQYCQQGTLEDVLR
jgi:hypothetical protein